MNYIYALKCKNGDLYIGYTTNLKARVERHLAGMVRCTKSKLPLRLIYYEAYHNKSDASKRERQLKGHKAKDELREQIKNCINYPDER